MGRVLAELANLEQRVRSGRKNVLLGPGSLHAATLHGGTGISTYADPPSPPQRDRGTRVVSSDTLMDSALLAAAGVETVVIGPSGGGVHATVEWVDVKSVTDLASILVRSAWKYCST